MRSLSRGEARDSTSLVPPPSDVGSVFGLTTFGELKDLVAVQRWNLAQLDKARAACPAWAEKDPSGYGVWAGKVYDASAVMIQVLEQADAQIALVPELLLNVTPVLGATWQGLLDAAAAFRPLVATYAQASGCAWPSGSPPQPTASDIDLQVYAWSDHTLKAVTSTFEGFGTLALVGLALFALMRTK